MFRANSATCRDCNMSFLKVDKTSCEKSGYVSLANHRCPLLWELLHWPRHIHPHLYDSSHLFPLPNAARVVLGHCSTWNVIVRMDRNVFCEFLCMFMCVMLKYLSVCVCYSPDDIGTCWYILLSGSVFIKESMFLPRSRYGCLCLVCPIGFSLCPVQCFVWHVRFHFSFGKRSAGSLRRGCECIVLEASEMIVVSYTSLYMCSKPCIS